MKVLSSVKHHKFPVVLHHSGIKRSSGLEAFTLGRNDWLVGRSIPLSKRHSELHRGRGSDHRQNCNAYPTSACASQTALHGFVSLPLSRCFFFQYLYTPQFPETFSVPDDA